MESTINMLLGGGGTRCVMQASFLHELQKNLEHPIMHYPDITGVVSGAIYNGLGLARTKNGQYLNTTEETLNHFIENAGIIFKTSWFQKHAATLFFKNYKYPSSGMDQVNQKIFGDLKMSDFDSAIFTYAYDTYQNDVKIITTWGKETFMARDVASATAAAPIFLQPRNITNLEEDENQKSYSLRDGGLYSPHPGSILKQIMREQFNAHAPAEEQATQRDNYVIYIGAGIAVDPRTHEEALRRNVLTQLVDLTETFTRTAELKASRDMAHYFGQNYLEFNCDLTGAGVSKTLDDASPRNMRACVDVGKKLFNDSPQEKIDRLIALFQRRAKEKKAELDRNNIDVTKTAASPVPTNNFLTPPIRIPEGMQPSAPGS